MKNKVFVLFVLFFCLFTLSAQNLFNFQFKKYQVNEGLSENAVTCILQDKKGFLWLGTKDGLNKFDGANFVAYRGQNNKGALGNNFIKSIAEAKNDKLYIGTDNGLYIMNLIDESFERLEHKLGLKKNIMTSITSVIIDRKGMLWITTMFQGVFRYNPELNELRPVRLSDYDLTKTIVWSVFEDKSGGIWIGSRVGLLQYNNNRDILEPVEGFTEYGNNSNKEILSIFEDVNGNLWLGTWSDGILFYNKQYRGATVFYGPQSLPYITHIRCFLQYDETRLLVGADDGLYLFDSDDKSCVRIDIPYDRYSLGDQNVYCMLRDHEGGIWVGTYFGGLNYLNTYNLGVERLLPSDKPNFLSGKAVSQFCEDKDGNLWIATEDGGLNYFDPKTKKITQPVKTSYHNIHPLLLVGDELWIGTFSRGIDVYNTKTRTLRNYRNNPIDGNSINDNCIFSLYQTKSGEIYVGTTMGLNRYNAEKDNFERVESGSISFVYDIKEDSYKNLWVASYNMGVIRYDARNNKWMYYNNILQADDAMVNAKLTGVYIDSQKRLWFSSEGRGIFLYSYEHNNFQNISEKDGLPNDVVYGILDDQFGNIWVSSNRGLVSFRPGEMKSQRRYFEGDGLQSNEFNYKASYKARDGKLYFGGVNGFNSFYPQRLNENINTAIPPVEIVSLELLGNDNAEKHRYIRECLNKRENIKLDYSNSSITISYICLSYIAQSKNEYAYKLEGIDDNWTYVGNNRSVTYVNLSPGKYKFRVQASNNNGVWNTEGAELNFEILPPFWLSFPAKVFYVLLFVLLLYLSLHYYSTQTKRKQQKQLDTYKAEQEMLSFKSKIDFFTNIAHEIRTPVSLIKAPLEEIIQSMDGNEETKQNLSIIEKNSDRLNVLINQLLDFRKMDSTQYTIKASRINLTKHLSDLYERFLKTAQSENIDLRLVLPKDLATTIISDADALTKIVGNFLTNALKYTTDSIELKLECLPDEGQYQISVSDNGKGIPDDLKEYIFDPFYQIKSHDRKKGTGIGLFLVRHLADVLGGAIVVNDNKSGGATFKFLFKSLTVDSFVEDEVYTDILIDSPIESHSTISDEHKSILVLEDNVEMLHFIENTLKNEYNVSIVERAAEAMSMIEDQSFDLIVTDIMMPDIDGLEFVERLRQNVNYSHIPIILLSAKTDNATKIDGLQRGADVFIEKPFSPSYLKAQIASLLINRKAILEAFNRSPLTSYSILTTNKSDRDFIERLNSEIDKHISDSDFSIESLSDKLIISRSNFQRKLKSICGYTPGEYLRTYRLKKAASLLLQKEMRINEIAFEVGFSSPSYFTKCFVKQFGVLPKEFTIQHSNVQHGDSDVLNS